MDRVMYKQYHEKFMQNHNGTTALDVFMTIAPNIFTPYLANSIINFLNIEDNNYATFALESVTVLVPVILTSTILAEFRYIWLAITVAAFLVTRVDRNTVTRIGRMHVDRRRKWECISRCRALTGLLTAHCILAVDFDIFPRYFAKTEQYGFSLMDTGVGLYVFCNAIVPTKVSRHSVLKSLEMNAKPCLILLILGFARTVILSGIDYQRHVTEYGLHWNFFVTLAVTKFSATLIMATLRESSALLCGIALLAVHEFLLQYGLAGWVFSNAGRYDFLTANREGFVSCLGFVALYLISVHVGHVVREKYRERTERRAIASLVLFSCLCWISVPVTDRLFRTSRSLADAGYCCSVLAVGVSVLTLHYLIELADLSLENGKKTVIRSPESGSCGIYRTVNRNGLLFFLLANVLTGTVNMTVKTLFASPSFAVFILFSYSVVTCALTKFIEERL